MAQLPPEWNRAQLAAPTARVTGQTRQPRPDPDLSAGMLRAARAATAGTGAVPVPVAVAAADAVALPLADQVADVTLSMHMLYHVPDRQAAVRELD
jgi:SAM-dependent methyltransferase